MDVSTSCRTELLALALALSVGATSVDPAHGAETVSPRAVTPQPEAPAQVPFIPGLTRTLVVSEGSGDYETLVVVNAVNQAGYKMTLSGETPDDSGALHEFLISRKVSRTDQEASHTLRRTFYQSDPTEFPGTSPEFTAAMIEDLHATGRTTLRYVNVQPGLFGSETGSVMTGVLMSMGAGPLDVPVLVNGRMVPLHAVHVAGRLTDEDGNAADVDFWVLDDARNPLRLRSKGPDFDSSVQKIDFPQSPTDAPSLEQTLTKDRRALVYGIYFKYARADLRPESERTLTEIAAVLRAHLDWHLSIVGHTDGIGSDAANLDLSRRRSESVRAALVGRFSVAPERLSTAGFGASQPQARNDTPEGRARNRRVELVRQ